MPTQSNLRRLRCRGIRSFSFILFICSFYQLDLHCCTCALFNCFNPTSTMAGAGESLFAMLAQLVGSYCKGAADFTLVKGFEGEKCFLRQPTSWMKMPCQPPSNACKCDVDLAVAYCCVWLSGVWTYKIFFVSATHCSKMIWRCGHPVAFDPKVQNHVILTRRSLQQVGVMLCKFQD